MTACLLTWALISGVHSAEGLVPVTTPRGATVWAEVANDAQARARGLMFREQLPEDRGMLFTFPEPGRWGFWMKNTKIPLDIIWMNHDKTIVHLEANVPVCRRIDDGCPQYRPYREASYVLEVRAGVAASLKLEEGMTLTFPGASHSPERGDR